jgi:hypothetical protein
MIQLFWKKKITENAEIEKGRRRGICIKLLYSKHK